MKVKNQQAHVDAAVVSVADLIDAGRRAVPTEPERVPELAHMDLARLRAYRRTLLAEEQRVSYWRRLIQARRDLLRLDAALGDRATLAEALTEARGSGTRTALLVLHPDGGLPILPHLPRLWDTVASETTEEERSELYARFTSAESVLSSYREALHRRLDRATRDLIGRYREDPTACFDALPTGA